MPTSARQFGFGHRKGKTVQAASPKAPKLLWNGGAGVDRDVPPPEGLNHEERRKWRLGLEREARRYNRRRVKKRLDPISESDIPSGSLLSDSTLEAIAAGQYGFQLPAPRPTPARRTYADKLKQRRQANKQQRKEQFVVSGFPGRSR
jgi:hypothetical protein